MPPIQIDADIHSTEVKEAAPIKPVIGIIYPPPEVRNIVDKTASFVARNGPEFESRIRQNELNNPKFNFLSPNDPYHAYYQHKVKEFKEGKGQEPTAPKPLLFQRPTHDLLKGHIAEPVVPKEPPPEYEFVADPPSISAFDLDVVKLTAQFVARNGRQFLTSLMNQQQRNYQFDFLRPQHSLFSYFTKLVEQYTKILIPPKDLLPKLRKEAEDPKVALEQVKYRVEWARFQERERQKEEEKRERERVSYAQIDWHSFVVVETVDYQATETGNLPPPTTPDEVGARVLAQERFEEEVAASVTVDMEMEVSSDEEEDETEALPVRQQQDDTGVQDMDEDSEGEDEEQEKNEAAPPPPQPPLPPAPPAEAPQPPPLPPVLDKVILRKDYNPKVAKPAQPEPTADNYLISPITGEKIRADKIQEHMRIGLLDRKWIEQRDRTISEKREQEEVFAAGSAIDSSLKQLAERRTDIFGYGTEEKKIGEKIGEEEKRQREKIIWDGHTASMEKVTQKARENISISEQIAVIHKAKGLLPDEEKEKIGPAIPRIPTGDLQHMRRPPMQVSREIHLPKPAPPPKPPIMSAPKSMPMPPPPNMSGRLTGIPVPQQQRVMVIPPQPPMMPPGGMGGMGGGMGGMGGGMGGPPVVGFQRPPMGMGPPRMAMQMPPRPGFMPPQPPMGMRQPMPPRPPAPPSRPDDEPPMKKARTEDSLLPERVFLDTHKSPVTFKVVVPKIPEKSEWKLDGQALTMTLPLTDNVSVIKAKLNEMLNMPAGKQKLQLEGLFIKDSNTLAYYNITGDCNIQLQLKERGGRKK
ncbi:Splicing factor 3A subunit 1 [Lamellibrachia satsuma]|nr:Splicing factor 3A subunit 1 [Lamellibrachia satsuma]